MSEQHAHQQQPGYYRFPAIHRDTIVFACEEDLWTVAASGGIPRRLTSGLGAAGAPSVSPDGKWLAFSGREEGPLEIWIMSAEGGPPRRLTFLGANSLVIGWAPDGGGPGRRSCDRRHAGGAAGGFWLYRWRGAR